ncbi:MAG: hypothetical protein HC845_00670 [Akkermansiaceae bacterium]|nr:hypothetical protein [Akkermansiaceae bacterium]
MRVIRSVFLCVAASLSFLKAGNVDIAWQSSGPHLQSNGSAMTSRFIFEVGGFVDGFVPTSENTAQWAGKWRSLGGANFQPANLRFQGASTLTTNQDPFGVSQQVYIWGYGLGGSSAEWVLIRNTSWAWPDTTVPFTPSAPFYTVTAAEAGYTTVVGHVNQSGIVIKSTAVSNSPTPSVSYTAWVVENFFISEQSDPAIVGQVADPDGDGQTNIYEYAFGTNPKQTSMASVPQLDIMNVNSQSFAQITMNFSPRAQVTMQLHQSSDLQTFTALSPAPITVLNTQGTLILRDSAAIHTGSPRKFYRMQFTSP